MRLPQFRAWDRSSNSMLTGFYLMQHDIIVPPYWKKKTTDCVWMQSISIKDKNGKEIFEGDIVRAYTFESSGDEPEDRELDDFTLHEVKWMGEDDYPAFDLVPPTDEEANSISAYVNTPDYSLEVVGNVWENPELVKLMKENQLI